MNISERTVLFSQICGRRAAIGGLENNVSRDQGFPKNYHDFLETIPFPPPPPHQQIDNSPIWVLTRFSGLRSVDILSLLLYSRGLEHNISRNQGFPKNYHFFLATIPPPQIDNSPVWVLTI